MPTKRKDHYLTEKRLLISNLQKCIRRGLTDRAIRTALCLLEYHPKQAIRRLPIIMVEDGILHPFAPRIAQMMINNSKDQELTDEDINHYLSLVRDLCKVKSKDIPDEALIAKYAEINPKDQLGPFGRDITQALYTRAKFGGMKWDIIMLKQFAQQWEIRFSQDEIHWHEFLYAHYPEQELVNYQTIRPLQQSDVLLESVDQHSSPLITILAKKKDIRFKILERFQHSDPKPVLKDVIWCLRSSPNPRRVFWNLTYQIDFLERQDYLIKEKFLDVYHFIIEETDRISTWYIDKLHKAAQS
mgnify:CR=1 FL=1